MDVGGGGLGESGSEEHAFELRLAQGLGALLPGLGGETRVFSTPAASFKVHLLSLLTSQVASWF